LVAAVGFVSVDFVAAVGFVAVVVFYTLGIIVETCWW